MQATANSPLLDTISMHLLHQPADPGKDEKKIDVAARDFESLLLGTWLAQAEDTFAKLPGGEDDDSADPGKDQFMSMAMQSLAASITQAGGIGIAKMISNNLRQTSLASVAGSSLPAAQGLKSQPSSPP